MAKYRVTIDRDMCIACGIAPNTCPQVFALGEDNGKNRMLDKYAENTTVSTSTGMISEELLECVKMAADSCPVQAITIKEI